MSLARQYLDDAAKRFADHKALADRAVAQVPDEALTRSLDNESNSIAILMRHLAGNMRSRWRDFLTTDGEKPDRHRDREFELPADASRATLLADWDSGWRCLFDELGRLSAEDMNGTVFVRTSHSRWSRRSTGSWCTRRIMSGRSCSLRGTTRRRGKR